MDSFRSCPKPLGSVKVNSLAVTIFQGRGKPTPGPEIPIVFPSSDHFVCYSHLNSLHDVQALTRAANEVFKAAFPVSIDTADDRRVADALELVVVHVGPVAVGKPVASFDQLVFRESCHFLSLHDDPKRTPNNFTRQHLSTSQETNTLH